MLAYQREGNHRTGSPGRGRRTICDFFDLLGRAHAVLNQYLPDRSAHRRSVGTRRKLHPDSGYPFTRFDFGPRNTGNRQQLFPQRVRHHTPLNISDPPQWSVLALAPFQVRNDFGRI
jgi:hypothetical protein